MFNVSNLSNAEKRALENVKIIKDYTNGTLPLKAKQSDSEKGYGVTITSGGVMVEYKTLNCFLRGVAAAFDAVKRGGGANQIINQNTNQDIHTDKKFRLGYMLDASRNAVATVDTVKKMAATLALMGYDYVNLYTEDTIEVDNNPYFGYMRGRYTQDEIKNIDAFCESIGIELSPCVQTLAHLNQIMRYAEYREINDTADILLCGDEKTYKLIDDLFCSCAKSFKSRNMNIGMDEAHLLGLGKYLDKYGYQTRYMIMNNHLKRVREIASKYGFKLSMWSDMFFRLIFAGEYEGNMADVPKEMIESIPKDITLIYWDYYSTDYNKYNRILKNHKMLTDKISFAGGAWKWGGFAPNNDYSVKTMAASIKACKDNKINDYLVTSWGDNGAEASLFSVLPSLYYVTHENYHGNKRVNKKLFKSITGADYDAMMSLDAPNNVKKDCDVQRNNASKFFLYDDLLYGTFDSYINDEVVLMMDENIKTLKTAMRKTGSLSYVAENLLRLTECVRKKIELSANIKKFYADNNKEQLLICKNELSNLIKLIGKFYKTLENQWHTENKPFGFEVQCQRLGGLKTRLEYILKRLNLFITEDKRIEELEVKHLPFAYFDGVPLEKLIYNLWNEIVSPSVM